MLRTILIIAIIALVLGLMGWLKFSNSGNETTIKLDKAQVKEDTGKAVEKAKEISADLKERAEEAFDQKAETEPAPATEPVAP